MNPFVRSFVILYVNNNGRKDNEKNILPVAGADHCR